jgi:exodeoxyribonuclease-3
MRIITWNVNGLRAAIRKGIDTYFAHLDADIILLQETRTLEEQLPSNWSWPEGYDVVLHPAEKKGYSGVATLAKKGFSVIQTGMPSTLDEKDSEGRILVTKHDDCICINTYLPSGSNKEERQMYKEGWMDEWRSFLQQYVNNTEPVFVCGDLNIAHTEDDIWNPKGNVKTSGFLPQEREWMTKLLQDGWCDVFRHIHGEGHKEYSWWSNRGQARANNRGWRIDYILCNTAAANLVSSCSIHRQGGIDISDHAPVIADWQS